MNIILSLICLTLGWTAGWYSYRYYANWHFNHYPYFMKKVIDRKIQQLEAKKEKLSA